MTHQSNNSIIYITVFAVLISLLMGCGGDEDIKDSPTDGEDTYVSTITIEETGRKEVEGGIELRWRLNANPAPKTDLAVQLDAGDWVIIPKFQNHSETFIFIFTRDAVIGIEPLPTVLVAGKGSVVNSAALQENLPTESIGGYRIPIDFDFKVYTIGVPSHIVIEVDELYVIDEIEAAFVSAVPASGSDIAQNGTILIIFDNNPGNVTTNAGTVSGAGKVRTINGPFPVGVLNLTVQWSNGDGSHTLVYTVVAPDEIPPKVKSSSPSDGAINVDPIELFENGIEIVFNEPVVGKLILLDGDDDVGWLSVVDGDTITLIGVAGTELANETEYTIAGTVSDGAGNEAEISITFVTRVKE